MTKYQRIDFTPLLVDPDTVKSLGIQLRDMRRKAERLARADECLICKTPKAKLCTSHSIPQRTLKFIARNGNIDTINRLLRNSLLPSSRGIKSAGTFKSICSHCDRKLFAEYESRTPFPSEHLPNEAQLAQIALKNSLFEYHKALIQIKEMKLLARQNPMLPYFTNFNSSREIDLQENRSNISYALNATSVPAQFHLIYHSNLNHTVPLAFQGPIALASDFEGSVVNQLWNMNAGIEISSLYICIFPGDKTSTLFAFCKSSARELYATFEKQLNSLSQEQAAASLLKIIFAYSEELYLSPYLPEAVYNDKALIKVANMSGLRVGAQYFASPEIGVHHPSMKQHAQEYAINHLPDVPNLLSPRYSLQAIKTPTASQ